MRDFKLSVACFCFFCLLLLAAACCCLLLLAVGVAVALAGSLLKRHWNGWVDSRVAGTDCGKDFFCDAFVSCHSDDDLTALISGVDKTQCTVVPFSMDRQYLDSSLNFCQLPLDERT